MEAGVVNVKAVLAIAAAPDDAQLVAVVADHSERNACILQIMQAHEKPRDAAKHGAASRVAAAVPVPSVKPQSGCAMISWCAELASDSWSLVVGCGRLLGIYRVACDTKQPQLVHRVDYSTPITGLWWLSQQGVMVATEAGWLEIVHCELPHPNNCYTNFAALADLPSTTRALLHTVRVAPVPVPCALVANPMSTQCIGPRSALLLGYNGAMIVRAVTWSQRVAQLTEAEQWPAALALAAQFWLKSLVSLAGGSCGPALDLAAMKQLLWKFVDWALVQEASSRQGAAANAIEYCCELAASTSSMRALATHELYTRFEQSWDGSAYLCALLDAVLERKIERMPAELLVAMLKEESADCNLLDTAVTTLEKPTGSTCEQLQMVVRACAKRSLRRAHAYVCVEWLEDWLTPLQLLLSAIDVQEELLAYLVLVVADAPEVIVSAVVGAFLADETAVSALLLHAPTAVCQVLTAHLCHETTPREQVSQAVGLLATMASVSTRAIAAVDALTVLVAASNPEALSCAIVTRATVNLARQPPATAVHQQLSWLMQSLPPELLDEPQVLPELEANGAHEAMQPAWVRRDDYVRAIECMMKAGAPKRALAYISLVCGDKDCSEETKQAILQAMLLQVGLVVQ